MRQARVGGERYQVGVIPGSKLYQPRYRVRTPKMNVKWKYECKQSLSTSNGVCLAHGCPEASPASQGAHSDC